MARQTERGAQVHEALRVGLDTLGGHLLEVLLELKAAGTALLFVHEFAGDHRSWEPQLRHFGQRYRAVAYNARGYPPSDVPPDAASLLK